MSTAAGWYVLVAGAQPAGPYDNASLLACVASGHVTTTSLLWKEGRTGWDPLSSIPDLADVSTAAEAAAAKGPPQVPAVAAAAAGAGAAPAHQPPTTSSNGSNKGSNAVAAAPAATNGTSAAAAAADDPLAEFQAEISAIEAAAAAAEDEDGRPATPDELEFEDDDGTMYVWDAALRKYVPAGSDAAAAGGGAGPSGAHPPNYDCEAMTFVAEEEVLPTLAAAKAAVAEAAAAAALGDEVLDEKARATAERKRKVEAAMAEHKEKAAKRQAAEKEKQGWFDLKVNTSVYITGLPGDVTPQEVCAAFTKCGIVKLGDDGQPRIKLYKDKASGLLKGDGLVTYLKEPSVALACNIMDGAPLRPGGPAMTVTAAKFEMKGGEYQAPAKGKAGKGKNSRKQQLEKLEKKLGWGGFDDKAAAEKVTVVLKHMFTPQELQEELSLAEELEAEITAECGKLGAVEKVRLYKAHPEGVVTVKFRQEDAAQQCLEKMDGRFFGGQRIAASLWDGLTNYAEVKVQETEEEQAARLEAYARELEAAAANAHQQQQAAGPSATEEPAAAMQE